MEEALCFMNLAAPYYETVGRECETDNCTEKESVTERTWLDEDGEAYIANHCRRHWLELEKEGRL